MKKIALSLLVSCLSFVGFSQKEGNIWYFGFQAGLDFNYNPPIPITGAMWTMEGCSSIADPITGQLLLYTDGVTVWDRNHNPMPASITTPLSGNFSSTQSGVIVPKPGTNTLYYIFTTAAQAGKLGGPPTMCYSIVDLSLNGGNGDLSVVNNVILDSTTEKVAVIGNCDRSYYWIVGHRWNCDSFYTFKLTASGLSAPIKSKIGLIHTDVVGSFSSNNEAVGYMKFSSDGRKLGLAIAGQIKMMEIFDFNMNTGIISNPITDTMPFNSDNYSGPYGCSFSPDNSKFYVTGDHSTPSGLDTFKLYQYDMNAGSAADIIASRTVVATANTNATTRFRLGALQNGPDGKMYVASPINPSHRIHVVNNPNEAGLACNFVPYAQDLGNNIASSTYGLPTIPENLITPHTPKFNLPPSLIICKGNVISAQQFTTHFKILPAIGFTISEDSTLVTFSPSVNTTYKAITSSSCASNDTIDFTIQVYTPVAGFIFNPADPGPADLQITLDNQSSNADFYSWYNTDNRFLSSATDYVIPHPGLGNFCYTLVAKDSIGCTDTVTKCVDITKYTTVFIPNTFSPNGDGINDEFKPYGPYRQLNNFSVYNRYGERIFYTNNRLLGWDGQHNSRPCDAGTYYYLISFVNGHGEKEVRKGDILLLR